MTPPLHNRRNAFAQRRLRHSRRRGGRSSVAILALMAAIAIAALITLLAPFLFSSPDPDRFIPTSQPVSFPEARDGPSFMTETRGPRWRS
ncbi:MAG: hypothetical protein LBQ12_12330 [Deltaproteobacteria bacterium]|nr:hypothetical protein [Deltaproteobacteria bacterium]